MDREEGGRGTGDRSCISGLSSASLVRAKGGGGGKKWTFFVTFGSRLYLLGRSLSNSVRDRAVLGVEFLGFGGALDECWWKERRLYVVASPEDSPLWLKAAGVE